MAILGGGVAGLSAAHELVDRGASVDVYERADRVGGKARTVPLEGAAGLHREHGFRHFPTFYRHLDDTLRRIPDASGAGTVFDHLVAAETVHFSRLARPDLEVQAAWPTDAPAWRRALAPLVGGRVDIPAAELGHFAARMALAATACDARLLAELEEVSWWDFIGAAARSEAYQRHVGQGLTLSLAAMRAQDSSARTVASVLLRLMAPIFGAGTGVATRVLDGPTSEVWLEPWARHLAARGVRLHLGATVRELCVDGGRITHARLEGSAGPVHADHFICAVPVDALVSLLDRSPSLRAADPALARVRRLRTAWMVGAQLFLDRDVPITRGHSIYVDSPWALTSIAPAQFWSPPHRAAMAAHGAHGCLSLIVSDWHRDGIAVRKPASACSPEELVTELRAQLEAYADPAVASALRQATVVRTVLDPALRFEHARPAGHSEPMLLNTAGSWDARPGAATAVGNLFLAADYVRTEADLACMEGANESARRAVGVLCRRAGLAAEPELVQAPSPPGTGGLRAGWLALKRLDAWRFTRGRPHLLDRPP